jgi:hypothetical protein
MKKSALPALLAFLIVFILLSYSDKILLGEVRRYDNAVLSAISAGIVFIIAALIEGSKYPRKP